MSHPGTRSTWLPLQLPRQPYGAAVLGPHQSKKSLAANKSENDGVKHVLGFWDLLRAIVGAPMAGVPVRPALAAAVSTRAPRFLAVAISAHHTGGQMTSFLAARAATRPDRCQLFVPQPAVARQHHSTITVGSDELAEHYDSRSATRIRRRRTAGRRSSRCWPAFAPIGVVHLRRPGARCAALVRRTGNALSQRFTSDVEAGRGACRRSGRSGCPFGPTLGGHRGRFSPDMSPGTNHS